MAGLQVKGRTYKCGKGYWHISVICPYCKEVHIHGGGRGEVPEGGHRKTHCVREVAGSTNGYTIDVP